MTRAITFELCAETLQACIAAGEGGADRIELCSALSEDGLTPSHGLIRAAVERSGLPVFVLLRPRAGNFFYSSDEFALMQEDLLHARSLGVSGFALGVLSADATVDIERTRELVDLAAPLEVTFHRAFDLVPSLDEALNDVIATGCRRILTSGGERNVVLGAANVARLVAHALDRITIVAGGGLRVGNAALLARTTKVKDFHGSMRRVVDYPLTQGQGGTRTLSARDEFVVDPEEIRAMLCELRTS